MELNKITNKCILFVTIPTTVFQKLFYSNVLLLLQLFKAFLKNELIIFS